jgi:hypothetical protein
VMCRAGVSEHRVALAAPVYGGGVGELLRDKTRKPGTAPEAVVSRLIARTRGKSQQETTHWTSRPMAGVEGLR